MVEVTTSELNEILARRAEYMRHRLTIPISEEQYLWWDDVIANHFDDALSLYVRLINRTKLRPTTNCFSTGLDKVLKVKFLGKPVTAHRFTFAIRVCLPLSIKQTARHQCANFTCLNAAHIELGDQAQNFADYLSAQAYGVRNELLAQYPLDIIK